MFVADMDKKAYFIIIIFISTLFILCCIKPCEARLQVYEGVGRHAMGEDDSPRMAKEGARKDAMRHIAEQVSVYVEGHTVTDKNVVTKDQVMTKTMAALHILGEPLYHKEGEILVCNLRAEADPDSIVVKLMQENEQLKLQDKQNKQTIGTQRATINTQNRVIDDQQATIGKQNNIIANNRVKMGQQKERIDALNAEKAARDKLHVFGNKKSVLIEVKNLMSFTEVNGIIERLKRIPGIKEMAVAEYNPKTKEVILDTWYVGDLSMLAAQVGKQITVNNVKQDAIIVIAN